jgi:Spy/CpxP family protein refolding chaperone
MKTRTLILIAMAALFLGACTQNESGTPTAPETTSLAPDTDFGRGGPRLDFLDLSDEQKTQVEAVFASFAREREALRTRRQSGASREELKAAHEELRTKIHAELDKILTAEQRAQLEEHQAKYGRRHGGPLTEEQKVNRLERRVSHLTEALGLTEEQQVAVRALVESKHANRPAPDGEPPTPEARHAHRAAFEAAMKEILTAEQFETFQELHQGHEGRPFGPRGGHGGGRRA